MSTNQLTPEVARKLYRLASDWARASYRQGMTDSGSYYTHRQKQEATDDRTATQEALMDYLTELTVGGLVMFSKAHDAEAD